MTACPDLCTAQDCKEIKDDIENIKLNFGIAIAKMDEILTLLKTETPLYLGRIIDPISELDYSEYQDFDKNGKPVEPNKDFELRLAKNPSQTWAFISEQIRNMHIDLSKSIISKVEPIPLPKLTVLELNEETEKHELREFDYEKRTDQDFRKLEELYGSFIATQYYEQFPWSVDPKTKEVQYSKAIREEKRNRAISKEDNKIPQPTMLREYFLWTNTLTELQAKELLRYESYIVNELKIPLLEYPLLEGCFPSVVRDNKGYPYLTEQDIVVKGIELKDKHRTIKTPVIDKENPGYEERIVYNGELTPYILDHTQETMYGQYVTKNKKEVESKTLGLSKWLPEFIKGYSGYLLAQQYITAKSDCERNDGSPYILMPDESGQWNTTGWYLLLRWKMENPENDRQKKWYNTTQLAYPIKEIREPSDPETVWDNYFSDIYQILGSQFGSLWAKNDPNGNAEHNKRKQLYRGYFEDTNEGIRFFDSIEKLSEIPIRKYNNPTFPLMTNRKTRIVNIGKKIILSKVCVVYKGLQEENIDLNQLEKIYEYRPKPKTNN